MFTLARGHPFIPPSCLEGGRGPGSGELFRLISALATDAAGESRRIPCGGASYWGRSAPRRRPNEGRPERISWSPVVLARGSCASAPVESALPRGSSIRG